MSSDVTRRRAWGLAAALGALAALCLLVVRDGPRSLGAPGPLALPHAGLACTSCHAGGSERIESRCVGCHGAHASARAAHRRLAASAALDCASCHAVHRNEDGVALAADGAVTLYGSGLERALSRQFEAQSSGENGSPAFVPLVRVAACARCHDASNGGDPAAHCLPRDGVFALCFDEHRHPAEASRGAPALRDAAVERARAVARSTEGRSGGRLASFGSDALPVVLGLGVAALALAFERRRRHVVAEVVPPALSPPGVRRLPVIDRATCLGCQACVDACPYDALVVRRYVAVLARPEACCGAGPCQESCPNGSLRLIEGGAPATGPRLSETLESRDRPGIFLAGDVTGGSLVRNALRQGVAAARAAAERVKRLERRAAASGDDYDVVIVGAGPAGLAAALTAQSLGLRLVVLEQARLAASIQSFSREKLVLDAPLAREEELPLFIGDVPKEELVQRWQRAVRAARLPVREGARVLAVEPDGRSGFRLSVEAAGGARFELAGAAVILSTGTRGTPRELDVPVEETAKSRVHYELSDARAFAGRNVVVVGLGDVAMESALALAAQAGTSVTVLHRGVGFRRGKQRNIDALSTLAAEGRVRLVLEALIERIGSRGVDARVAGVARSFPCDAVFVHVGRVPAHELLTRTGACSPNAAGLTHDAWDSAQHDRPSS